jgi:hypothetical protein
MMAVSQPIATSAAALLLVASAPSAPPPPPPWHDGIEHDAVAAVSVATIADAPIFRRVRAVAFERGSEADVRAVCGEVVLPGTRHEHIRFAVLYRRDGPGSARIGDPLVEEWAADEPLSPPRLLPWMWRSFCSDAAPPPPPVLAALDDP